MRLVAKSVVVLAIALSLSNGKALAVDIDVSADVRVNAGVSVGAELNIGYFHEQLAPHGTWIEVAEYGRVWQPKVALNVEWRPYMDEGHWIWTDQGWYWDSTYEWGWAAFHYGRWNHVDKYNWVWSPDVTWAPAWVSWRHSELVYGWAPLSYGSRFEAGVFVGVNLEIGADYYNFVPARSFLTINLGSVAVPRARVATVYNETKIINNTYTYNDNRVINNGIPVTQVAVATRQEIKAAPIADSKTPATKATAGQVSAFRPAIKNEQPKAVAPATKPETDVKTAAKPDAAPEKTEPAKPKVDAKPETDTKKPAPKPDAAPEKTERTKPDAKPDTDTKPAPKPDAAPEKTERTKPDAKPDTDTKPAPKPDAAPEKTERTKPDAKPDTDTRKPAPKSDAAPEKTERTKPDQKKTEFEDPAKSPREKEEPAKRDDVKVNSNERRPDSKDPRDEPAPKPAKSKGKGKDKD